MNNKVTKPPIIKETACSDINITGPCQHPSEWSSYYRMRYNNDNPIGYQPKRPNPGGLKFSMYDYPFHTQNGKPLSHPGIGWYNYQRTGGYYTYWD